MKTAHDWLDTLWNRNSRIDFATDPKAILTFVKSVQTDAIEHAAVIAEETQRQIWTVDSPEAEAIRWVNIEILKAARKLKEP